MTEDVKADSQTKFVLLATELVSEKANRNIKLTKMKVIKISQKGTNIRASNLDICRTAWIHFIPDEMIVLFALSLYVNSIATSPDTLLPSFRITPTFEGLTLVRQIGQMGVFSSHESMH